MKMTSCNQVYKLVQSHSHKQW